jgi:hypothetical protein
MTLEAFRDFCLALPDTTVGLPFGPDILVFKVKGKMFAATDLDAFESINLKCAPEKALQLREEYAGVLPGYHMKLEHSDDELQHPGFAGPGMDSALFRTGTRPKKIKPRTPFMPGLAIF